MLHTTHTPPTQADLQRETTQNANASGRNQTAVVKEIPQQQAGPTAEAPSPPKAVLLKQTLTAEWSQAASTANPLAAPVHMTEGSLAQHTCQNTAHPAPQARNAVCTTVSPRMNNKNGARRHRCIWSGAETKKQIA